MPNQSRKELRPLVFRDASDYSPVGRVGVALQRFMALGKEINPIEAIRTSNMLVHPEDITKILQTKKRNKAGDASDTGADLLPDMKPSSFAVTPEADIDKFLSAAGSPHSETDSGDSSANEDGMEEEVTEEEPSPFGLTPSGTAYGAPPISLRTATAAADQALYSNYHIVIVLDVSQSAFAVARNGDVLIDRMPSIIDLIIQIIRDTIKERVLKYEAAKKRASGGRVGDAASSLANTLLHRVWLPKISVSLLLGNAPFRKGTTPKKVLQSRPRRLGCTAFGGGGPPLTSMQFANDVPWGHATTVDGSVPFVPHNTENPFEPWPWHMHGNGGISSSDENSYAYADIIPVFIARPAEEVVADESLNQRIFAFLRQQEIFIRALAADLAPRKEPAQPQDSGGRRRQRRPSVGSSSSRGGAYEDDCVPRTFSYATPSSVEWESSNIPSLIESIVSMLPSDSTASHTVAIISNFANTGASEDVALLRPAIMARGVTLGLFSLTAVVEWNWSHLAPIGCLLSTTGGFSVPYSRIEMHRADPMNSIWLRRIDGTDCLAKSMFLRRLTDYPGVSTFLENGPTTLSFLPQTTPHGEMQTAIVYRTTTRCYSTLPITGLAAARVAEGWSAYIELDAHSHQPRRCRARHNCFLHRGELTFYYEAEATTLVEADSEGRAIVIESSLIAYASSHVIADMAFILKASEDMRLAIEKKGGRRLTISALLRQFLSFMKADVECAFVSDVAHVSLRNNRPSSWDDNFIAAVSSQSRPLGCTPSWQFRHSVRQLPMIIHVPGLTSGLAAGSLLTHEERMVRMGSLDDGIADSFDTAAAWRRSRSSKVPCAPTASRRQANAPHPPPAVTSALIQAFVTAALTHSSATDLCFVKTGSTSRGVVSHNRSIPAGLSYAVVSKDLLLPGMGSLLPSCGLVQFFLVPGMSECGQEIVALESHHSGGNSAPLSSPNGSGYAYFGGRDVGSVAMASDYGSRASYFLCNCIEIRFTFSFVSIRNQAPMIRKIFNLLEEHSSRLAAGDPLKDFRFFGVIGGSGAMQFLQSPFQHCQPSLLLTDSEGTSSATNSRTRAGRHRFLHPQTITHAPATPAIDESGFSIAFDRISSLSSASLQWSTLIPCLPHTHLYRNTMSTSIRRRIALGFEMVQYTACGTWAALFCPKTMCFDTLQVHEHPSVKGYDCIITITRSWQSFDLCARPRNGWQSFIDFQRDHFVLSTFYSFNMVLSHTSNKDRGGCGGQPRQGALPKESSSGSLGNRDLSFFKSPSSIAAMDFVRNGGHTTAMFCLSGLLVGVHTEATLSCAPIDCVCINVGCHTSLSVGIEVVSRMHAMVRNLSSPTKHHLSHTVGFRDLPSSMHKCIAPAGLANEVTVTLSHCSDSSFLAIIIPNIPSGALPARGRPAQGDVLRVYVVEISIDSVVRGMSQFTKTALPKTFFDCQYAVTRPMLPEVPRASPYLITICAALEVFCVASRAWLLQRAAINIPKNVPIPKGLRKQMFHSFKGLSLYSKDVDITYLCNVWQASRAHDEVRLASILSLFLGEQYGLRPLQGPLDNGDDEMARTTFLVSAPSLVSSVLSSHAHNINSSGGAAKFVSAAEKSMGMGMGMGSTSAGSGELGETYTEVSDGHMSSASGGRRADGEGGQASASAVIDAPFVPLVLRFLIYGKDADGHGTSAWIGSKESVAFSFGGTNKAESVEESKPPVSLFLRIFIVSLPHDVFNITSHCFKPPSDIIRRFVQGISEDLASAKESVPPSWNYFNSQPFTCDDLLLPFNAMPREKADENGTNIGEEGLDDLTDPMLLRFVRLFPCRCVGDSNQLPSPSCTDIVNGVSSLFLAQAAHQALTLLHTSLVYPPPTKGVNEGGVPLDDGQLVSVPSVEKSNCLSVPSARSLSPTVSSSNDDEKEDVDEVKRGRAHVNSRGEASVECSSKGASTRRASLAEGCADNGDNTKTGQFMLLKAEPYFGAIVSKALLAPDNYYKVASEFIEGDMILPDVSGSGKGTEQLLKEEIHRNSLPLIPLGNMSYGFADALRPDGSIVSWGVVCINGFDNTMTLYQHVTRVTKSVAAKHEGAEKASEVLDEVVQAEARNSIGKVKVLILESLRYIYLSQYLFKLRATRWANEDDFVIPRWWGVQYPDAVPPRPNLPPPPWELQGPKPLPAVRGQEVLTINVHPQFQPKRLLNQMHFSRHFDMLKIVDRRGCFVVPDDVTDFIWHYIRILLVPEGSVSNPDDYPPILTEKPQPGSRYRLVVHLYKSTAHFCIDASLQALRECYESIAVKELMQYIGNSNKREALTDDDMALLVKERVENGCHTVPLSTTCEHRRVALDKLQSNLLSYRFLPTKKWAPLSESSVSLAAFSPTSQPHQQQASTVGDSTKVDDPDIVRAIFIYHNPAESIDIIVVTAEVTVDFRAGNVCFMLFSSWSPRYEEEVQRLARCISGCRAAIENTQKEIKFVSIVDHTELYPLENAPSLCDTLVGLAESLAGSSSELRHFNLKTTPRLSAALFSQYVESFCGVLSELGPSVVVFDRHNPMRQPEAWSEFSWARHEETQHRKSVEGLCFYIVCGLRFGTPCDLHVEQNGVSAVSSPSRVKPQLSIKGLPSCASTGSLGSPSPAISSPRLGLPIISTPEPQMQVTAPVVQIPPVRVVAVRDVTKRYVSAKSVLPAVVVRITVYGTSLACHSIPEADVMIDALTDINNAFSKRLGMLNGLLTQMLGIQLAPFSPPVSTREFTQGRLATRCCGDVTNVHREEAIDITMGYARRFMSMSRLPTTAISDEALTSLTAAASQTVSQHHSPAEQTVLNHQGGDAKDGHGQAGTTTATAAASVNSTKASVLGMLRRHLEGGQPSLPSVASLASLATAAKETHMAHQENQMSQQLSSPLHEKPSNVSVGAFAPHTPNHPLMALYVKVIYSGLTNRGVMVDYCLPLDAAVKVLHDDGGKTVDLFFTSSAFSPLSQTNSSGSLGAEGFSGPPSTRYGRCEVIVKALVSLKMLVESKDPHNAGLFKEIGLKNHHAFAAPTEERQKVVEIANPSPKDMPVDPFIPQHYHRHLSVGHIVSESQFMARRMADYMTSLQVLWNKKLDPNVALPIVNSLIRIMSISKYYYGSRVPEYSLRREATAITPEIAAKYCNPTKKVAGTPEGEKYAGAVRKNLMNIVEHLNNQFESLYMVAVDPEELAENASDPMLLERLSNRCGLVISGDGGAGAKDAAVFTTNVIYCALPIRTAIAELLGKTLSGEPLKQPLAGDLGSSTNNASVTSVYEDSDLRGGLLVMEVGFNYVNYAIDMYVAVSEESARVVSPDLISEAACAVRSRIQFSSAVYDLMTRRLFDLIKNRTAVLPGHQNLTESLANITKYNPTPPRYSYNMLSGDNVTALLSNSYHRQTTSLGDGSVAAFISAEVDITTTQDNKTVSQPLLGAGHPPTAAATTITTPSAAVARSNDVIRFVVPTDEALLSYPVVPSTTTMSGNAGEEEEEAELTVPDITNVADGEYYSLSFKYVGLLSWETARDGSRKAVLYTLLVHPNGDAMVTGGVDTHAMSDLYGKALLDARSALLAQIQSNDEQALIDRLWREVKRGLSLRTLGEIIPLPRKEDVGYFTSEAAVVGGGFPYCPSLSFGMPPLPERFLPPNRFTRISDLVVGLDDDGFISWEDLVTLERFVTRVVDTSSLRLLEELSAVSAEVGPDAAFVWRARVPPTATHLRTPTGAVAEGRQSHQQGRGLENEDYAFVTLSFAEAVCAYLRGTGPSLRFLERNRVSVHISDTERFVSAFYSSSSSGGGGGSLGNDIVGVNEDFTEEEPIGKYVTSIRLVFAPQNATTVGAGAARAIGRSKANFLVVVEITRPSPPRSYGYGEETAATPYRDHHHYDADDDPHSVYLSSHHIDSISVWREGYGAYGEASAELSDDERAFLGIVHSYIAGVMWAGFL